jgi:hypothetical protein
MFKTLIELARNLDDKNLDIAIKALKYKLTLNSTKSHRKL